MEPRLETRITRPGSIALTVLTLRTGAEGEMDTALAPLKIAFDGDENTTSWSTMGYPTE